MERMEKLLSAATLASLVLTGCMNPQQQETERKAVEIQHARVLMRTILLPQIGDNAVRQCITSATDTLVLDDYKGKLEQYIQEARTSMIPAVKNCIRTTHKNSGVKEVENQLALLETSLASEK